jgi:hypothetical protein
MNDFGTAIGGEYVEGKFSLLDDETAEEPYVRGNQSEVFLIMQALKQDFAITNCQTRCETPDCKITYLGHFLFLVDDFLLLSIAVNLIECTFRCNIIKTAVLSVELQRLDQILT